MQLPIFSKFPISSKIWPPEWLSNVEDSNARPFNEFPNFNVQNQY